MSSATFPGKFWSDDSEQTRRVGFAGVLMCAAAVYNRLSGSYFAGGFQIGTLLQAGMAALLVACLRHLMVLINRPRR